ncbi:hypothetical protein [Streptomyces sp. NPDC000410]|uniref:hypothetical protein n=1 Tax=Streptomyces sp. NPDC000410 TaxID=3154254 RepID=UPI003329CE2C
MAAGVLTSLALVLAASPAAVAAQGVGAHMSILNPAGSGTDGCKGHPRHDKDCKPAGQTVDVGASVFSTVNQTIPSGMLTQITFNGAAHDTDAMFDPATSSLVVNTPGRYLLKARLLWSFTPTPAGERALYIFVNGTIAALDLQDTVNIGASGFISQEVSTIIELNAGDVIRVVASQATGNNATSQSLGLIGPTLLAPQLQAELLEP